MRHTLFLRSPKKEEEQVIENSLVPGLTEFNDVVDELEGVLGIENMDSFPESSDFFGQLNWDILDWEGFGVINEEKESDQRVGLYIQESHRFNNVKRENCGFWDDYDQENKKVSLNLSLNYQEVLDAWSDRGSLFAHECALSMTNSGYMGEVPIMEEDRRRRKASVLRYKEKRQSRLFSKRIRYQVRKLNADNRPRLKGRFVKKVPEKRPKG